MFLFGVFFHLSRDKKLFDPEILSYFYSYFPLKFQVHGAFLSGLREAGRIADYFLGFPTAVPSNDVLNNHQQANKKS